MMNKNKKSEVSNVLSQYLLELERLKKEVVIVRSKLKMAKLDGDLSENADKVVLSEKLEILQKRIIFLQEKLFQAKDKIQSEILITYRLLENGEEKEVRLTEDWAADPDQGRISLTSPLGLALVNKKIGEISEICTKEKSYKIQIINIKK